MFVLKSCDSHSEGINSILNGCECHKNDTLNYPNNESLESGGSCM